MERHVTEEKVLTSSINLQQYIKHKNSPNERGETTFLALGEDRKIEGPLTGEDKLRGNSALTFIILFYFNLILCTAA